MLSIPVPFLVSLLLVALFVAVLGRKQGRRRNGPLLLLILMSALQSALVGLRWGYGIEDVKFVTPVVAACVPPLVHAGASRLVGAGEPGSRAQVWIHAVPVLLIAVLSVAGRALIDLAVVAVFLGYAVAVLRLLRRGTDGLKLAPLENAGSTYRAVLLAAAMLLFIAALDTLVFLDFLWAGGENVSLLLGSGELVLLTILALAAALASRGGVPSRPEEATSPPSVPDVEDASETYDAAADAETLARIETLMKQSRIYRDANLNLDRLSRKAVIPARRISQAINRATGMNVSQYVNEFRIAEACELLETTRMPVTEIIYEVGFQTKSNFNRAFRSITDTTPQDWRQRNAAEASQGAAGRPALRVSSMTRPSSSGRVGA